LGNVENTMEFFCYWDEIKDRIENEFVQWIPELLEDLPARQYETIRSSMDAGKKVRGCLVCLTCNALGGDIEVAVPRAVAIECIHAASLIHDDYVDGDRLRRNHPAIWTVKGSRKAVLLADIMFAKAIEKMVKASPADTGVIAQVIATMAKGAYQEYTGTHDLSLALAKSMQDPKLYDRIIYLKTGSLFGAAAQLGALAADASGSVCEYAFSFAARVGQVYQIADDLCEVRKLHETCDNSPSSLAVLVPALWRFAGKHTEEVSAMCKESQAQVLRLSDTALQDIASAMEREIMLRLDGAGDKLKYFPAGPYTELLGELGEIVINMLLEPATS